MSEEKLRIHTRVTPETQRKIESLMPKANCQSRSEFLDRALQFYCSYLSSEDATEFLLPIMLNALRATVQMSENRMARLMFKQSVELDMMMNVLAAGLEIDPESLDELRGQCVRNVKATSGAVKFKDAVKYQQGMEDTD